MPEVIKIEPRIGIRGQANIFLSGQPAGVEIGEDTVGPQDDPKEAPKEYRLQPDTRYLLITTCGGVQYGTDSDTKSNADGKGRRRTVGPELGISRLKAKLNTLVGVFLTDDRPIPGEEPPPLDKYRLRPHASRVYGILNCPFSIGVGPLFARVPDNATRLFLGCFDTRGGNHNNSGAYYVAIVEYSA